MPDDHKPRVSVCKPYVSQETIDLLEQLLEEARKGEVVGIAYVAQLVGGQVGMNIEGELLGDPMFTAGALQLLEQRVLALSEQITP